MENKPLGLLFVPLGKTFNGFQAIDRVLLLFVIFCSSLPVVFANLFLLSLLNCFKF